MSSIRAQSQANSPEASPVHYDGPALVEVEIEGIDYRLDVGKQGTALSLSTRASGTWDWVFGGEARWDGSALRARAFERGVLQQLSTAVKQALAERE